MQERPPSPLTFVGNKEFDKDTLKKALKEIGIAEARIFDRSALDRAEQELKRQYIDARQLRRATVDTTVTPQERNRVAINFTIDEGETANIARINIVGNKAFTERQLRREMTLTTPDWLTWYTKDDQYSKQKLEADLETLRSYYQNRGYLEFNDRLHAGVDLARQGGHLHHDQHHRRPAYTVSDVQLAGELVVPEAELRSADHGSGRARCSRARSCRRRPRTSATASAPTATRSPTSTRCRRSTATRATVAFTFYVDPGRRVYVRKINISGNPKTRDEVIRREMRQLEGAWYDGTRIERSKVRVRRLGYFERASTSRRRRCRARPTRSTSRSPWSRRRPATCWPASATRARKASCSTRRCRSRTSSAPATRCRCAINTSKVNRTISVTYTEPYWTVDGVSRTLELYDKTTSIRPALAVAQYASSTLGAAIGFGVPITETDTINFGFARRAHRARRCSRHSPPVLLSSSSTSSATSTNSYIVSAGWSRDTRDDILYPTRGRLQSCAVEVGLPFGDLRTTRCST